MASYLVLTSPGAPRDDAKARFIGDRFSWTAFVFPAIWLLVQRQWIAGIVVAVLQGLAAYLTREPSIMLAGLLIELALRLLVALEGPAFVVARLEAGGWTLRSVVVADDRTTAEMIYDQPMATDDAPDDVWQPPSMPARTTQSADGSSTFGLFANYGER